MLEELVKELPNFGGKEAHVRCFSHSINLMAKGVLRPFEPVPEQPVPSDGTGLNTGLNELLAELRKIEEEYDADDTEGFIEVLQEMSDEEREQWERDVEPVKMALFKVCKYATSSVYPCALFPSRSMCHLYTGSQNFL